MIPVDDPGETRVDNPLGHVPSGPTAARMLEASTVANPQAAAVMFGRPTAMTPAQPKAMTPAGPPPEIGLTQHHLPPEEELDPRLVLVADPDSERAASFRVLRHHLLELGRPQVIVVSSPHDGDGKTTIALNLALALAECGRAKVLIAEAHLRRPQLSAAFKLIPPWCFAEQLAAHRNQPMLPWSLVEIPQLWLHVAAVNPRIEKTQLLDAPAFAIAMERLRLALRPHRDRWPIGARLGRRQPDGRRRRRGGPRGPGRAVDDPRPAQGHRSDRPLEGRRHRSGRVARPAREYHRRMRWLALVVISACGFAPHATGDGGETGGEMIGGENPGSEPPPPGCHGTGLGVVVCFAQPPQSTLQVLGTRAVDTTPGSLDCQALIGPTMNDYCVLAGTSVSIGGFLYAHGPRPLVIVSLSTLDVGGTIDVASHRSASPQLVGPGGDDASCGGTETTMDTGAGFGGSLGSQGGDGGSTTPPDGAAGPMIAATTLHGGCRGGYGLTATINGVGGHGGGIVDLIAEGSISVLGTINASGSGGGGGGATNNGGGGGGSGGMIVLDAPLMTFDNGTTVIFANGGGGGGGSSSSTVQTGSNGGDPANYTVGGNGGGGVGPVGGPTSPSGGLGGDGASAAAAAATGHDGPNGGGNGGGGGGVGIIRVFRAPPPAMGHFSPMPT